MSLLKITLSLQKSLDDANQWAYNLVIFNLFNTRDFLFLNRFGGKLDRLVIPSEIKLSFSSKSLFKY